MKIFGLGFHKTGSTTLETALIELGYDAVGKKDHLFDAISKDDWETIDKEVAKHDAFRDMPWPLFYKELYEKYPNSKFILTVRDSRKWIESCKNHYKEKGEILFENIYGKGNHFPIGNEDKWLQTYLNHNEAIRNFFSDKKGQFLEVNWEKGDDWKKLCSFLDKPIPTRDFPHANKGKYTLLEKMIRRIHYLVDKEGFKRKNRDL